MTHNSTLAREEGRAERRRKKADTIKLLLLLFPPGQEPGVPHTIVERSNAKKIFQIPARVKFYRGGRL